MASIVQIQLRRDTAANWTANNPTLAQGEPALETDTGRLKFGDGATAYNSLAYFAADKNFVFTQGVAAGSWNVAHNLNKLPAVQVFDSAGTPLKGEVNHVDNNNLIIKFNNPVSGNAYLN
jgi:hypothetical protein